MSGNSEAQQVVTVTLHNVSLPLLHEFAKRIVGPYFGGDLNKALAALLDKALIEEELFQAHVDKRRRLG